VTFEEYVGARSGVTDTCAAGAGASRHGRRYRMASGHGDLAQWTRRYSDAYEQALGTGLEPGSLEVVLR
jgi:hypothetical protein